MYELLVLPKEWLFSSDDPYKYDVLSAVINKAYSKPMAKYGIIQTTRVKDSAKFLEQLQLTPEKECFIALLLASSDTFSKIEKETGFVRKFDLDVYPLKNCYSSDIPKEYKGYFEPLSTSNVKVTIADSTTKVDSSIADRFLALCGYKTFYGPEKKEQSVREYELTSFTSFLSGMALLLLDYTLEHLLCNAEYGLMKVDGDRTESCIVHAVVIKEHDLVPYYTKCCRFDLWGHPDSLISASETNSQLEFGVLASRDFHLSFLRREVAMVRA